MPGVAKLFTLFFIASFFTRIYPMEATAIIEEEEKRILSEIMRSPNLPPTHIDTQDVIDQRSKPVIVTQLLGTIVHERADEDNLENDLYSLLLNLFGRIGYPTPHEMLAIINVHFMLNDCPKIERSILRALAKAYKHNEHKAIERIFSSIPWHQIRGITDMAWMKQRISILSKTVMFCQALQKELLKGYPSFLRSLAPYWAPVLRNIQPSSWQNLNQPSAEMLFEKTRYFATFIMLDKMLARQFPHNAFMLSPRTYCWLYGATAPFLLGGMCDVVFKPRVSLAYEASKIYSYSVPLCIGLYWMAFPQVLKINNYLLGLIVVHQREHACSERLKQLEAMLSKLTTIEQADKKIAQLAERKQS